MNPSCVPCHCLPPLLLVLLALLRCPLQSCSWYHYLLLELIKSLLFKVGLESPYYFSNLYTVPRVVMMALLKTVIFVHRKSGVWLRGELVSPSSSLSSRPPVKLWIKNGDYPGLRFFYHQIKIMMSSFFGFWMSAVFRYTGLLQW